MSPQPSIDLQRGLENEDVSSSQPKGRIKKNVDRASTMSYSSYTRRRTPAYKNYGDPVEFKPQGEAGGQGITSPPLWKSLSPPTSPPTLDDAITPAQRYNNYSRLSPTSRTQAVARGRQELMEMVKNMPETFYELSLKDLVEKPKFQEVEQVLVQEANTLNDRKMKKPKKVKKSSKKQMLRTESMNNGHVLLKMFFPIPSKRKAKGAQTGKVSPGKVSPRPSINEGGVDKEWWKKRSSFTEENENDISIGGSSSTNSNSSANRNLRDNFPSCLSFFQTKKTRSKGEKYADI